LRPLHTEGFEIVDEIDVQEWTAFVERAGTRSPCLLERSRTYVAWRASRPGHRYVNIYVRDAGHNLVAWALARLPTPGASDRLYVGDYLLADAKPPVRAALWAAVRGACDPSQARWLAVIDRPSHTPVADTRLGFVSRAAATPLVAHSHSKDVLATLRRWDYRDADVDMF
jgi:hypothetical protein